MRIDHEQRNSELNSAKAQIEMLRDKIALLRSEFFKNEAKSKEENAEVKAKVVEFWLLKGCPRGKTQELREY